MDQAPYNRSYDVDESVLTTGYHSMMSKRESQVSENEDASFVQQTRIEGSEVSELEIELLVDDLRGTDWLRLGSQLGVSKARMAALYDHNSGDLGQSAREVLLLWRENTLYVGNPRSQLALALSTIGREDLYKKIKQRAYVRDTEPSSEKPGQGQDRPRRGERISYNGSSTSGSLDRFTKVSADADRTLERAESGVDTFASLSDSLEDDSDEDRQSGHSGEAEAVCDQDISSPVGLQISEAPSAEQREEGDNGISANAKSRQKMSIPVLITTPATPEYNPVAKGQQPQSSRSTVGDGDGEDEASRIPSNTSPVNYEEPVEKLPSIDSKTTKMVNSSSELSTEISEDELHILAGDFRSAAEWQMLGNRLGVTPAEMKEFSVRHGDDVTLCASAVMKLWKQRNNNVMRERRVLASVMSDVGRDDLYTSISSNKLKDTVRVIGASLQSWRVLLQNFYLNPNFLSTDISTLLDLDLLHRDIHGNEYKIPNRHGLLQLLAQKYHETGVVLHGDAGCGKTTLLQQLARDWAEGNRDSELSNVPIVFSLNLGELGRFGSVGQYMVRYFFYKDPETTAKMVDDFLKLYPEKVVLLLDGNDLSDQYGRNSELIRQIQGQTRCRIVIASRTRLPEHVQELFRCCSVEVRDLSPEQKRTFIHSYFETDVNKRNNLVEFLRHDDILSGMCARLKYLSIVCNLWNENPGLHDVNTQSDLLMASIGYIFRTEDDNVNEHHDAVETVHKVMSDLGKIALNGIMGLGQRWCFRTCELQDCEESAEIATRVGLLVGFPLQSETKQIKPDISEDNKLWSFCHPLIHERIAAVGLSELWASNREKFEESIGSIHSVAQAESLRYMLMFACSQSADVAKRILKLLGDLSWKETDPSSLLTCQDLVLKCNFECHCGETLNRDLQFNLRSLQVATFTKNFLSDVVLRYFIKASITDASIPFQLERVIFKIESRSDINYARACLQNGYFVSVPEMHFEMPKTFSPSRDASRKLAYDVMSGDLHVLKVFSVLSSSDFISNLQSSKTLEELVAQDIDPKYVDIPSWCKNYPNLRSLSLSCVTYRDPANLQDYRRNLKSLKTVLVCLSKLKTLYLGNFFSSEMMIQVLTETIAALPELAELQFGPVGKDFEHYSDEVENVCGTVSEGTMQGFVKAAMKSKALKTVKVSCFGNFEKLYQLMRAESRAKARKSSLQYFPDTTESGYWVFRRPSVSVGPETLSSLSPFGQS